MSTTLPAGTVDVRGPRFSAWVTTIVLVAALLAAAAGTGAAVVLLAVQAAVFAVGTVAGPRHHPYGRVFARFVAPRLAPVRETEPVAPLRFAQLLGLVFTAVAVAGFAAGVPLIGFAAAASALAAAFLNAAFGVCLGCQLYPLVLRLTPVTK